MSTISTIIPIREITTDINRDTRNNHHPSSYDQSDHTLASKNLSSAGTLSFRDLSYVVQDDIISGTLTVRENLMFSANVRLSSNISWNERKERVERVIQELGLLSCADTRIGTLFLRDISGGERKRTCIGMELVLEPKILFLDEPTTGLDFFQ
jgi:ABC-type multidrug transport system ATPase subunit